MPKTKVKKILIVEDEKPLAKALELKLKHEGFEAQSILNGGYVQESLEKESYDLIILDLVMPIVDGFEVLEKLKKDKNKIPIIVLSNLNQGEDERKVKELGAVEFFVKSNTPITEMVKNIKKVLKNI